MLRALPASRSSSAFRLVQDDREVGRLTPAALRERATFAVKDVAFAFYREGMRGDFVLEFEGSALARAQKPSVFTRRFMLEFEGRSYTLAAASAWKRAFVLREGDAEVGRVRPLSAFHNKTEIDLPDALPLPVQAFVFWLVLILWERAAAASG